MPTATLIKDLSKRRERERDYWGRANGKPRQAWHKGTALYELSEPIDVTTGGFYTMTSYLIVAYSPKTSDHGKPETQAFYANNNGSRFGGFTDKSSPDKEDWQYLEPMDYETAAIENSRIIGRFDPAACLAKIGYRLK